MRTRTLAPAPAHFRDTTTGTPAYGSYRGSLPQIDLGAQPLVARIARRKKWLFVALVSDELWISFAVVRTGYAASAFAYAFDRRSARLAAEYIAIAPVLPGGGGAPGMMGDVTDDARAPGIVARFERGRERVLVERARDRDAITIATRVGDLALDAELDATAAPPAISAIVSLGRGLDSATEKRVLANVRGSAVIGGRRHSLDGALGGYDYTHGLMPRRTRWRWAFAMGRATDGTAVAFNVVSGFVGEAECAAFDASAVHPLGEPRFELDVEHPERPWRLTGGGLRLTFAPGAVHRQRTNLVVVRSRFVQPVGSFDGTVLVGDRELSVHGLPGVVEDQDVLW